MPAMPDMPAMQYGRVLERIIREVFISDPAMGPVHVLKSDGSDSFYRTGLHPMDSPAEDSHSFRRRRQLVTSDIAHPPYGVEKRTAHIFHGDRDSGSFSKCSLTLQHTHSTA